MMLMMLMMITTALTIIGKMCRGGRRSQTLWKAGRGRPGTVSKKSQTTARVMFTHVSTETGVFVLYVHLRTFKTTYVTPGMLVYFTSVTCHCHHHYDRHHHHHHHRTIITITTTTTTVTTIIITTTPSTTTTITTATARDRKSKHVPFFSLFFCVCNDKETKYLKHRKIPRARNSWVHL